MFVSSEVDDQKEEEKDAKTKTPFIIYSVCDVLHFRLQTPFIIPCFTTDVCHSHHNCWLWKQKNVKYSNCNTKKCFTCK